MTVSGLWSALDEAGCGRPVGLEDFSRAPSDHQTVLAVDLSIWICEGLTSTALTSFHSDPALHLVWQRTTKLLSEGLGLVFVSEGQRRVRSEAAASSSTQAHELKQRRSGSLFWNASKRCETLLQSLGVPVVRAEAEGEALCALLNARGLVDGVVSNDGDCLLFGAKTIYTGFSADKLEARQVMRYDADKLVANLDGESSSSRTLKLSREDLVAFALLTGSDLVGTGVNHVGHRKAIQALHAIRSLKHPCHDRSCLDELLSWSDEAAAKTAKPKDVCPDVDDDGPSTISSRCCSLCLHPGDKRDHEKHGCAQCGTGPGEGCYVVTSSEKFLRALKEKASGWLAPRQVVEGYFAPNSNQVPEVLLSLKTKPYSVAVDARKLFSMDSLILKGRSKQASLEYIHSTLPKLMARLELWDTRPRNVYATTKLAYKPIPVSIDKALVKQSSPCYEITWALNLPPSEIRFCTVECQTLIQSNFPQLVKAFHQEERRKQQGRNHEERRKQFAGITGITGGNQQRRDLSKPQQGGGRQRKKRERNFDAGRVKKAQKTSAGQAPGSDVSMLMCSLQSDGPANDTGALVETKAAEAPVKEEDDPSDVDDIDFLSSGREQQPDGDTAEVAPSLDAKLNDEEEWWYSQQALLCEDDAFVPNMNRGQDPILDGAGYSGDLLRSNAPFQQDVLYHHSLGEQDVCNELPDLPLPFEEEQPFYQPYSKNDLETSKQLFSQSGCAYEGHRCSSDINGKSTSRLTPSTRLYCDMGSIQIEVTPLKSRRWRLF
ncbi:hypothetical protein ACHAXT_010674 [Thalassiosira profunda]